MFRGHLLAIILGASGLSFVGSAISAAPAVGASLTDHLLATLLDRRTQSQLYRQGNNPWPGGSYTLEVLKNGQPTVISSDDAIHVKMPLKIDIKGDAASTLLKIKLGCSAHFTTVGEVIFSPGAKGSPTDLKSRINMPIPAVVADCDGMQLAITPYLEAFLAQNKQKWEREIDARVNAILSETGSVTLKK